MTGLFLDRRERKRGAESKPMQRHRQDADGERVGGLRDHRTPPRRLVAKGNHAVLSAQSEKEITIKDIPTGEVSQMDTRSRRYA